MKEKFTIYEHNAIPVLCTRCGDEYLSGEMVCGRRDGDTEWEFFCRNDDCYGRVNSGIYEKTT